MAGKPVTQKELEEIWAMRPIYNGMTDAELSKRYGDHVYRVAGEGWFIRETSCEGKFTGTWSP